MPGFQALRAHSLTLKWIDWNLVASQLDITNGHAARMRFSRFKQHMEGVPPIPRKPRVGMPRQKKPKIDKTHKQETKLKGDKPTQIKPEPMMQEMQTLEDKKIIDQKPVKKELVDKDDDEEMDGIIGTSSSTIDEAVLEEGKPIEAAAFEIKTEFPASAALESPVKAEPLVKMESVWED